MSKYLIKPTGSIYLSPQNIYDLKRDLLFYDKLGMLNLDELLEGLYKYKQYPAFQNALNELEYLIKRDLFVELRVLAMPFAQKGSALMDANDLELGEFTMKLNSQMTEEKNISKRNEIYWMHDELNTRLWCNIVNRNNEAVYTVPSLKNNSTFELQTETKQKAYNIIHRLIPLPSDETPWEQILEYKEDNESQLKLFALKNWINDLPENIKKNELEDKIQFLVNQYSDSLRRHKIQSRLSTFKTIVTTIPTALTEIVRLRFDKAIEAFFSIAEQQVNFNVHKERSELSGNELAYISHVNTRFNKKTLKKRKK